MSSHLPNLIKPVSFCWMDTVKATSTEISQNIFISCVSGFNFVVNTHSVVVPQTHFLSHHIPHTVSLWPGRLRSKNEVRPGPPGLQIPLLSGINVIGLSQLPGAIKAAQVTHHAHTYAHMVSNIKNGPNKGKVWVTF